MLPVHITNFADYHSRLLMNKILNVNEELASVRREYNEDISHLKTQLQVTKAENQSLKNELLDVKGKVTYLVIFF